jgi:two-component system chemotaxis response regulator CheY
MVVDDAGIVRQVCTMTLRRAGFSVRVAEDGQDALEKLEEEPVDLIVTDINMPVMDGIELIRRLRAREEFRYTPIVVLSTVSEQEKLEAGKKAGASSWVLKPFDGAKLLAAIRGLV